MRCLPRLIAQTVMWPLRAAGELWGVRSRLPAMRAAAVESVRLCIEADGVVPLERPNVKHPGET